MAALKQIGQVNNTTQLGTKHVLMSSLKTCIEMLQDRGHEDVQACQTFEELQDHMLSGTRVACAHGASVVHVFFSNDERVGVKHLRSWVENSTADKLIIARLTDRPLSLAKRQTRQMHTFSSSPTKTCAST